MNTSDPTATVEDKLKFGISGPIIVYGLFFAGLLHAMLPIVGVVLAYFLRSVPLGYFQSHFTYLIRTFWIALAFYVGIFVVAIALFFPFFKSFLSSKSTGSGLNEFTLNILGNVIELTRDSPFAITADIIIFIIVLILLSLAFIVWYVSRLVKGVRALYLGQEALLKGS